MKPDRVYFALGSLAAAARGMADSPYDHSMALSSANVTERGDDLTPLAMAWAAALPDPHRTLIDYEQAEKPTGNDMAEVFERAKIEYQQRVAAAAKDRRQ